MLENLLVMGTSSLKIHHFIIIIINIMVIVIIAIFLKKRTNNLLSSLKHDLHQQGATVKKSFSTSPVQHN